MTFIAGFLKHREDEVVKKASEGVRPKYPSLDLVHNLLTLKEL